MQPAQCVSLFLVLVGNSPVSICMYLHALTLVTRSYALLCLYICLAQYYYLLGELECFLLFFVSGDRDRRPLDGEGVWCLLRELGEGECFCRLGEEEGERRFVRAGEWFGLHFLLLLFGEFSRLYLAVREAGITANEFYKYNNFIKSFIKETVLGTVAPIP